MLIRSLLENTLHNPIGLLFIIITFGVLIGQFSIKKIRLGGSGVLLVGLIFGHFGFTLPSIIQTIGVVFFVYSIGIKAGPHFFQSLKRSKGNFVLLSLMIVGSAISLATCFNTCLTFHPN